MTWDVLIDLAKMVAVVTGWSLIVGAAWGLLVFAVSFAAWLFKRAKDEAQQ
jgi:hypothetical protein